MENRNLPHRIENIALVGAGGFSREVQELIAQVAASEPGPRIVGTVASDPPNEHSIHSSVPYLGTDAEFMESGAQASVVIAIGDPTTRRRLAGLYEDAGYSALSLVHPTSQFGGSSSYGEGTIICAFVSVTSDVRIGRYVHLDRSVTIGHDCIIDDFVTIYPAAVLAGGVTLGEGVVIGSHATVLPGISIGAEATVGAGAVVTRDVDASTTVAGVPARRVRRRN